MLDSLHARLRQSPFLQRCTAFTRVLLALGFIPPGMTKVLGQPFTIIPPTDPVGYFFDAFFQAAEFYAFVGLAQVLAAVLLLFPRTATLGAVIYFPIIVNIMVVTVAIGFPGTRVITVLMTGACLYLLFWDYDRLKTLLPGRGGRAGIFGRREYAVQAATWALAGIAAYGLGALINLANIWTNFGVVGFGFAVVSGAVFGLVIAWHLRRMPAMGRREAASPSSTG